MPVSVVLQIPMAGLARERDHYGKQGIITSAGLSVDLHYRRAWNLTFCLSYEAITSSASKCTSSSIELLLGITIVWQKALLGHDIHFSI